MDTSAAIKLIKKERELLDTPEATRADKAYMEALSEGISALKERQKHETVMLVAGYDENGNAYIDIRPSEKTDTLFGRIFNTCVKWYRAFGYRIVASADCYILCPNRIGCKECYHRADYIVFGWLCSLGVNAIVLVIIGLCRRFL